jgi:hypothetical protein
VRADQWPRPRYIRVDADVLQWDVTAWLEAPEWTGHGPELLSDFVALADAPSGQYARYASRWGMLGLCNHMLPTDHPEHQPLKQFLGQTAGLELPSEGLCYSHQHQEGLDGWRYWARQARAVIELASALRKRHRGNPRRWEDLFELGPWSQREVFRAAETNLLDLYMGPSVRALRGPAPMVVERREAITAALDFWAWVAGLRLSLRWETGRPESVWTGSGLFGAIGLRLHLAVTGAAGWAACSGCGSQHIPSRPTARTRSFCSDCRLKGVDRRLAQRDLRERRRRSRCLDD